MSIRLPLSIFICLIMSTPITAYSRTMFAVSETPKSFEQEIDEGFGTIVGGLASVFLWDVFFWD